MISIKRLSKSKLNTFKQCPLSFYNQQKYPTEFVSSPAMERGKELHQIFEDVFSKSQDSLSVNTAPLTSPNIDLNYSDEQLDQKENELIENLSKVENSEKYKPQLKKFVNFQRRMKFMKPESFEEKVYDEELDIVAIWDRVDFDGEKRCMIDYKSGQLKKVKEFKFELLLYSYIYMRKYKRKIDYIAIYFIDHGVFDLMEITKEDVSLFIIELEETKTELRDCNNNNTWPAKRGKQCNWCPYKNRCPLY